jgi:hypothetical protein
VRKPSIAMISLLALVLCGLAACGGGKSSNANSANTAASTAPGDETGAMRNTTMPNCGAVRPVWVNLRTKVYHKPDDPVYGRTKHGEYLCPSQAEAQGFRPAGGEMRRHRHKRAASATE